MPFFLCVCVCVCVCVMGTGEAHCCSVCVCVCVVFERERERELAWPLLPLVPLCDVYESELLRSVGIEKLDLFFLPAPSSKLCQIGLRH